jgi:hypothetical protein
MQHDRNGGVEMMRRARLVGLCLLAVCAASAMVAESAWAGEHTLEEAKWRTCVKSEKVDGQDYGYFTNNTCSQVSETHEGAYEEASWSAGQKVALKGKGGKTVLYIYGLPKTEEAEKEENVGIDNSTGVVWRIECAKSKSVAEVTGPREGSMQVTFEKCTGKQEPDGSTVVCSSAAGKGKIATANMPTRVGKDNGYVHTKWEEEYVLYVEEGGTEPELEFISHKERGEWPGEMYIGSQTQDSQTFQTVEATFECGSTKIELRGGLGDPEVVSPVSNGPGSRTIPLSFRVYEENKVYKGADSSAHEGEPVPWGPESIDLSDLVARPAAVVDGTFMGAGFEMTETLKVAGKTVLVIGNDEPNTKA